MDITDGNSSPRSGASPYSCTQSAPPAFSPPRFASEHEKQQVVAMLSRELAAFRSRRRVGEGVFEVLEGCREVALEQRGVCAESALEESGRSDQL